MWLLGNGYGSGLSGALSQSASVGSLFCFRFGVFIVVFVSVFCFT